MLLPAPDGPTIATFSPALTDERNVVDREHIRPRRIGEADIVETDIAARRHRQRDAAVAAP